MTNVIEPLEKMLAAESPRERVAAAVTLVPLGKADLALPVINDAIQSQSRADRNCASAFALVDMGSAFAVFPELEYVGPNRRKLAAIDQGHEHDA